MGQVYTRIGHFLAQLVPGSLLELYDLPWTTLCDALIETLQMAVVGTVVGVIFAWLAAACAAKTLCPALITIPVRFVLNVMRTIPSLIWALLFVAAFGLGSFAGVCALSAYSIGYLAKFFYEAFEGVEAGPPQALLEIGATGLQRFLFAVWPAAVPAVVSSSIFMLEYNVRAASILGIVDAGGIGFYMKQYLDYRAFPSLFACLILLLAVVLLLDSISRVVRSRLL